MKTITTDSWAYCQIHFQISDDGRGFSEGGLANRQMWIRFIAQSENKTIRESIKLPIHTSSGVPLAPNKNDLGQKQVLEELIDTLKWDGWEITDEGSGDWWQIRLRRLTPFQQPEKPKFKLRDWLTLGILTAGVALLGLAGIGRIGGFNPYRHYTSESLELASSSGDSIVEQMVIINLDDRELDPLQESLPADLAATDAANAETVVWIDCHTDSNWRGAKTDCNATVIDWSEKEILDEQLIEGEFTLHPENNEPRSESAEYRDDQAILNYLASLPRK